MCNIFGDNKHYKTAIVCVTVLLSCFCLIGSASSLTYQSSVGVNFTFNPTINLSVGGNLLINNLTPGNSSDSNIIDVAVSTNASYGYVLSATVGQKNGTDSLVNTSNSTYTFTNLSTTAGSAATLSNFADNKWGYSYSVDSGTNWISGSAGSTASGYAGLLLDNNDNAEDRGLGGVTLIDTDNPADNQTIKFKIGAKAAATQAAGTYTNTINFYVVANARPDQTIANSSTMQEVEACPDTLVVGQTYNLEDTRDHQSYNVARLPDGKCWMVENLNLAGGTALSADNSDVTSDYISSFTTSNNLTKSGNTIVLPASSTSGFDTSNYSYVYNSSNKTSTCTSPGCYSYYSWDAATLGSGRAITTNNTDAEQSICPRGWHLPNTRTGTDSSSDFRALMITYGGSSTGHSYTSGTNPTGGTMYNSIRPGTTPNFLLAGDYVSGSFDHGGSTGAGNYWSATSASATMARYLLLYSGVVNSASDYYRYGGFSVRCLFSEQ